MIKLRKILKLGIAGGIIYVLGLGLYNIYKDDKISNNLRDLNQEKSELVQKIKLYKTIVPMMKKPYVIQYEDTLKSIEVKVGKIEFQEEELEKERKKFIGLEKY